MSKHASAMASLKPAVRAWPFSRAWLMPTWDRFALVWPLSRVVTIIGEPRFVPRGLDDAALERLRSEMGAELDRLYEQARALLRA